MPLTGSFTGVGVLPTVVSATLVGRKSLRVTFSEAVEATEAGTPGNYTINEETPGTDKALVAIGATPVTNDPSAVVLTLDTTPTPGTLNYTVVCSTDIEDLAGNPVDDTGGQNEAQFDGTYIIDRVQPLGLIEAITSTIGEADAEIGGHRITRTTAVVDEGDTTIPVGSALDWPEAGSVGIDGVKYSYTSRTDTILSGITYVKGGVETSGAATQHRIDSTVADISKEWNALEQLRRAVFVDYADGEDLNAIARNVGVNRLQLFEDDDQFRGVIKAIAYNPKGTYYGIDQALDALVGAGNYEIYEDLLQYPNTIFIRLIGSTVTSDESQGKTFVVGPAYGIIGEGALDPNEVALPANTLTVGSVRLHKLNETFDFRNDRPSELTYAYYPGHTPAEAWDWMFTTETEATAVTVVADSHCALQNVSANVQYRMVASKGGRITPQSYVEFGAMLRIPTGSSLSGTDYGQISLRINDGAYQIKAGTGTTPDRFTFYNSAGSSIGNWVAFSRDTWYDVRIRKYGESYAELWVDGKLIERAEYSEFTTATASITIEFGINATTGGGKIVHYREMTGYIDTPNEYWSVHGTGSVNSASPDRLTGGASDPDFLSGDVGKRVSIRESAVTNAYGGNNNGEWYIDTFVDVDNVDLIGATWEDASVSPTYPDRITLEDRTLVYPDDLGKDIVIENGTFAGTYIIDTLLDPDDPSIDLDSYDTPLRTLTNVCEVTSGGFTSADSGLDVHLEPTFDTEASLSYELSDAGSIVGTSPNQIATLRQDLWATDLVMAISYTDVLSAQILPDNTALNEVIQEDPLLFEYYPFYIANPLGLVEAYLDAITAAGVIPDFLIE